LNKLKTSSYLQNKKIIKNSIEKEPRERR